MSLLLDFLDKSLQSILVDYNIIFFNLVIF